MYANPKSQGSLMNGSYFKSFKKTVANMFSVENYALNWEEKNTKKLNSIFFKSNQALWLINLQKRLLFCFF